jgi:hypothetical protein
LEKAEEPVVLTLVRAPPLEKKEMAEFFGVSESDFESEDLERGRYNITVYKVETAIKMFNNTAHNAVNPLSTIRRLRIVALFYSMIPLIDKRGLEEISSTGAGEDTIEGKLYPIFLIH